MTSPAKTPASAAETPLDQHPCGRKLRSRLARAGLVQGPVCQLIQAAAAMREAARAYCLTLGIDQTGLMVFASPRRRQPKIHNRSWLFSCSSWTEWIPISTRLPRCTVRSLYWSSRREIPIRVSIAALVPPCSQNRHRKSLAALDCSPLF